MDGRDQESATCKHQSPGSPSETEGWDANQANRYQPLCGEEVLWDAVGARADLCEPCLSQHHQSTSPPPREVGQPERYIHTCETCQAKKKKQQAIKRTPDAYYARDPKSSTHHTRGRYKKHQSESKICKTRGQGKEINSNGGRENN